MRNIFIYLLLVKLFIGNSIVIFNNTKNEEFMAQISYKRQLALMSIEEVTSFEPKTIGWCELESNQTHTTFDLKGKNFLIEPIKVFADILYDKAFNLQLIKCDTTSKFLIGPDISGFVVENFIKTDGNCYYSISSEIEDEILHILWYNNGYHEYYGMSTSHMYISIPIIKSSGNIVYIIGKPVDSNSRQSACGGFNWIIFPTTS